MFKTLLTTAMLTALALPAWAGPGHDHSEHGHSEPELVITAITPDQLKANQENEVVLFVQDKQAQPVDVSRFEVAHTKPVHLLIIEPELNDYHHEHPVQTSTGQYAFNFTPQTTCSYRIWVDVQLKGSDQQYVPVDLKGAAECKEPIDKTVSLKSSSQGYDFKLELEGDLKAGEAVMSTVSISKDGQAVNVLEPVMGAFAHMVGFYEDYESIAHIHPMGVEPTEDTERSGPTLQFHIEPEQAGYLKLFVQVQIDGKQIFAPFSILVE